jgi:hypothetical protein
MRILNYNIEYGGFEKKVDPLKYVELVQKYAIDIFICTESHLPKIDEKNVVDMEVYGEDTMKKVAKQLGYYYITTDDKAITIISKYVLERTNVPEEHSSSARLKEQSSFNVPFVYDVIYFNHRIKIIPIHLVDYPFTFYSLRNVPYPSTPMTFNNKKEIVDLSYSTKSSVVEKILQYIKNNPNEKIIIAGDFNEPSHLDDTNEWIVSKKFEEHGLIDSYRSVNKKVKLDKLGYNTDGATCCNLDKTTNEPLNRVDYIYTKNLSIVDSYVLKEYVHYSDHLPVFTEVDIIDYGLLYMKYKLKYYLLKNELV